MGHASKLLAAVLAALAAASFATPGFAAPAEAPFVPLDFRRVDETPEGFAKFLADRFRSAAEWAVPRDKSFKPLDCSVEFVKDAPRFNAFTVKGRNVRIVIGGPVETFPTDAATLRRLMATLLLARAGIMAEGVETGFPEWLADGLARKAVTDIHMARTPGGMGFPGAIALASAGVQTELKAVVEGRLLPSDGVCYDIQAEYCHMLLLACAREGMSQSGAFRAIVRDAAVKGGPDRYSSFLGAYSLCLAARAKAKGKLKVDAGDAKASRAELEEATSVWFKGESKRMFWNVFTPAPAKRLEAAFKEASRTSYLDKTGVERVCELDELCSRWDSIGDPRLVIAIARGRMTELSAIAPEDVQDSLVSLQSALNGLLAGGRPKNDALVPALEAFYSSLEGRLAFEARLKRIEREVVPPCARFGFSLRALAACDAWEEAPFEKESAFLDGYLAKARK